MCRFEHVVLGPAVRFTLLTVPFNGSFCVSHIYERLGRPQAEWRGGYVKLNHKCCGWLSFYQGMHRERLYNCRRKFIWIQGTMTSFILWQLILVISLQSVRRRRPSFKHCDCLGVSGSEQGSVACTKRSIPSPLFVCVCAFDWTGLLKLPQEDHRWFHANWGSEVQFLDNGLNMKLGRWTASRTVTVVFCREMDAAGTGWAFLSGCGADHSDWWASISFGLTTK